ncbi:MAG: putative colanic acid biosynthesis acetyltransferase [Terracidiphilus sp.]|jgi:putative colanic acid biosynthesis acetyltransferase WcaF
MSSPVRQRERAVHNITASAEDNPYHRASFSLKYRLVRLLWQTVYLLFYRTSPRPMHAWRAMLLRLFGAKMGPGCHFYPSGKVWVPWNLTCEDCCTLADHAEIYNPSPIYLESHCIVSQQAFLCGASHDYNDPDFPMISYGMRLGAYSWICARASVSPGVTVGEGAVLGLGSVAYGDLEPWTVYSGVPAEIVRKRERNVSPD